MKRKVIATLLAATMVMSLAACGSGGDNGSSGGDAGNSGSSSESDSGSSGGGSGDSIRLVNGKIEIDSQLKKLAEMYPKTRIIKTRINRY